MTVCACVCIFVCICIHVRMYTHVPECVCTCLLTCGCMCACASIGLCTHMFTAVSKDTYTVHTTVCVRVHLILTIYIHTYVGACVKE